MTVIEIRRRLKTARGQLLLFGMVYCGAIVMAFGSLILKTVLFEPYVRHRLPPLGADLKADIEAIATGAESVDEIRELSTDNVAMMYGGLINAEFSDPSGRVISGLVRFRSEELLDRLQTTVATGTADQKLQALRLLEALDSVNRIEAIRLTRILLDRALRTGDREIRDASESALRTLTSDDGDGSDE